MTDGEEQAVATLATIEMAALLADIAATIRDALIAKDFSQSLSEQTGIQIAVSAAMSAFPGKAR